MAKKNAARRAVSGGLTVYRSQMQKMKDSKPASRIVTAAKKEAEMQANTIASIAGGMALAYAKKKQWVPAAPGGIEPALFYGGLISLLAPRFVKGRNGQIVQAVGTGILTVGAYNYIRTGNATLEGVSPPPGYFQNSSDVEVE